MRWTTGSRGSINDMRGASGGGRGMIPLGIGGFIVVALLSMFTGVDFFDILGGGGSTQPTAVGTSGTVTGSPTEEKMVDMVDAVATDVQQTWTQALGGRYQVEGNAGGTVTRCDAKPSSSCSCTRRSILP